MFINNAIAQAADVVNVAAPQQDFSFMSLAPLVLIFAVFYFLIVRPQTKKMKELQAVINNLKIGNKVITNSGIIGTIKDVNQKDGQFELEIASGVVIKILKSYIAEVVKDEKELVNKK